MDKNHIVLKEVESQVFNCPRCGTHYEYKTRIPFSVGTFKCPRDGYYFNNELYKVVQESLDTTPGDSRQPSSKLVETLLGVQNLEGLELLVGK